MAFQRTVKLAAACLLLSLAGCSQPEETAQKEPVQVLAPAGAPALATLGLDETDAKVDYVQGQDILISELAKSDGDYDVIIAPINLGIKSWSEAENYNLDSVVTWGNLYMVGTQEDWNVEGNTIAAFGEGAVPALVFGEVFDELNCDVTFYPSVAEASQALQSGAVNTALLAQPAAGAALAKTQGAAVQADLQELWQQKTNSVMKGYPQAAVFVKKGEADKLADLFEKMDSFLETATPEEIEERTEAIGPDTLGVPSAKLAASTWQAQNIHYQKAVDVKDDIVNFLQVFNMTLPEGILD